MKAFNLKEYLKNPSKKIVTRDGRNVTIHCANCVGPRPVVAEIEGDNYSLNFDKYGRYYFGTSDVDLFFAVTKHADYINLYRNEFGYFLGGGEYSTEEEAKTVAARAGDTYITTIKLEREE